MLGNRVRQPQTTFATPNASAVAGEFDLTPLVVIDDEDGLLSDNSATPPFVEPIAIRAGSRMPPFENGGMGLNHSMGLFGGLFNQSGHGSMDPSSSFMERTIANPIRAGAPSDQFSFKRGRKFTGTSQQSGQPSMRVQLSIISVKDRGTSVTARLSSLDTGRVSPKGRGFVQILEKVFPNLECR